MFGCEVGTGSDRGSELSAVSLLGGDAVRGAHLTPTFALRGGLRGAHLRLLDHNAGRPQAGQTAVRTAAGAGLPGVPVDATRLDRPGHERVACGKQIPVGGNLDLSVLGIPRALPRVIHVEMLSHQLELGRSVAVSHDEGCLLRVQSRRLCGPPCRNNGVRDQGVASRAWRPAPFRSVPFATGTSRYIPGPWDDPGWRPLAVCLVEMDG